MSGRSAGSRRRESDGDEHVHDVLRNERRRRALEYLLEAREPVPIGDLTTELAAAEADGGEVPDDLERSVYVSLYQNHLPKLEEAGIVERDDDDLIELTGGARRIELFLRIDDRLATHGRFAALIAGIAALALAVTGLAIAGIAPVTALSPSTWSILGLGVVCALAFVQYGIYRRSA